MSEGIEIEIEIDSGNISENKENIPADREWLTALLKVLDWHKRENSHPYTENQEIFGPLVLSTIVMHSLIQLVNVLEGDVTISRDAMVFFIPGIILSLVDQKNERWNKPFRDINKLIAMAMVLGSIVIGVVDNSDNIARFVDKTFNPQNYALRTTGQPIGEVYRDYVGATMNSGGGGSQQGVIDGTNGEPFIIPPGSEGTRGMGINPDDLENPEVAWRVTAPENQSPLYYIRGVGFGGGNCEDIPDCYITNPGNDNKVFDNRNDIRITSEAGYSFEIGGLHIPTPVGYDLFRVTIKRNEEVITVGFETDVVTGQSNRITAALQEGDIVSADFTPRTQQDEYNEIEGIPNPDYDAFIDMFYDSLESIRETYPEHYILIKGAFDAAVGGDREEFDLLTAEIRRLWTYDIWPQSLRLGYNSPNEDNPNPTFTFLGLDEYPYSINMLYPNYYLLSVFCDPAAGLAELFYSVLNRNGGNYIVRAVGNLAKNKKITSIGHTWVLVYEGNRFRNIDWTPAIDEDFAYSPFVKALLYGSQALENAIGITQNPDLDGELPVEKPAPGKAIFLALLFGSAFLRFICKANRDIAYAIEQKKQAEKEKIFENAQSFLKNIGINLNMLEMSTREVTDIAKIFWAFTVEVTLQPDVVTYLTDEQILKQILNNEIGSQELLTAFGFGQLRKVNTDEKPNPRLQQVISTYLKQKSILKNINIES